MATTYLQDKEFLNAVIGDSILEPAIEWIASNMDPEEVFDDRKLETWAENNGYVKE
jgi:hypothetical protein